MVSKRRLDCGFNGYRAPIIPRAPRSIRRKGPCKKLVEDSELCAFELLAAVAGKLLQESESSASSNAEEGKTQLGCRDGYAKMQPKDDKKALKSESFDHGSCAEGAFDPEISIEERNPLSNFEGIPQAERDHIVEQASVHASSDLVDKFDCDIKLETCEDKDADENATCKIGGSVCVGDSFSSKVESGSGLQFDYGKNQIGYLSMANTSPVNDPVGRCVNTNVLVNSGNSVNWPLYRNSTPGALCRNNVKLGSRDDDENYFRCSKASTKSRLLRPQPRIGRRRLRKMTASNYWKAAPKLKGYELYNTSEGMKSFFRYRKSIFAQESCEQAPLKKRKLSDHSFHFAFGQERRGDMHLPEIGIRGASESSTKGHPKSRDPHVKFSIKSFKMPELHIEVPETATVGSLKRTVMDAVTAILGGGIRVGVVFQGRTVKDDHRTLHQTGISLCSDVDNLGFILEPSSTHVSPPVTPKKPQLLSSSGAVQTLPGCPASPTIASDISNASVDPSLVIKSDDVDKNELLSSLKTPDDALMDRAVCASKALFAVPPVNAEALAVVPANLKSKSTEASQRRTRRPFSVAEVEALVEAVEQLGTGRWREVKMRAFENADHRTYVDLKDKWKTLVHTASISPQQRRGEPVPHELLSRVLSTHSYWLQHQSKQLGKHPVEPLKIVNSREEIVGVGA